MTTAQINLPLTVNECEQLGNGILILNQVLELLQFVDGCYTEDLLKRKSFTDEEIILLQKVKNKDKEAFEAFLVGVAKKLSDANK